MFTSHISVNFVVSKVTSFGDSGPYVFKKKIIKFIRMFSEPQFMGMSSKKKLPKSFVCLAKKSFVCLPKNHQFICMSSKPSKFWMFKTFLKPSPNSCQKKVTLILRCFRNWGSRRVTGECQTFKTSIFWMWQIFNCLNL